MRVFSPVIEPGHAVLRLRDGSLTRLTGRALARPSDRFYTVDLRRQRMAVHPQTIPTADNLSVTISLSIGYRVTDPKKYILESTSPTDEVYLAAQIALRSVVAGMKLGEIVDKQLDLTTVAEAAREAAASLGLGVDSVVMKDIMLPMRYAEALEEAAAAAVTAATDLERARTEVKTTRARLGTAKVLEQNPVLARLALIEALPAGATVELRDVFSGDSPAH